MSNHNTLHLVLKSVWYDKIASGEKTSEYRECKPYWNRRFAGCDEIDWDGDASCSYYDTVVFHRGYTAETMEFGIRHIHLICDKPNDLGLFTVWEIKLAQRIK